MAVKTEYRRDAQGKYLVLRIHSYGSEKRILVEDVGKFACDHDSLISDEGRCWDCGVKVRVPREVTVRSPIRKFLKILSDEEWHVYNKLPKGVGVNTVRFCIDQAFVATKMVDRKRQGDLKTYRTALRITRRGKTALRNNSSSPTA